MAPPPAWPSTTLCNAPVASSTTCGAGTGGSVAGQWCRPVVVATVAALTSAGLFLHGGAFVVGPSGSHRKLVSHLVSRTGGEFFILDSRLVPAHPFSAALDNSRRVPTRAYRFSAARNAAPCTYC